MLWLKAHTWYIVRIFDMLCSVCYLTHENFLSSSTGSRLAHNNILIYGRILFNSVRSLLAFQGWLC